jgi:hypothetical protein
MLTEGRTIFEGGYMALFGEKCHRCGKRTRNKQEDEAICETCVAEMDLLVQAEAERARKCPVDGHEMTKQVAHMLVIDRCPSCQGVWLDGGELDRIRGGVEAEALQLMARGFTFPV